MLFITILDTAKIYSIRFTMMCLPKMMKCVSHFVPTSIPFKVEFPLFDLCMQIYQQ